MTDTRPHARKRARIGAGDALFGVVMVGVLFYFGSHALLGDYGALNRLSLNAEIAATQTELAELRSEEARLANQARRLNDDYLDLDLLDESARAILSLAHPNDAVLR